MDWRDYTREIALLVLIVVLVVLSVVFGWYAATVFFALKGGC